MKKEIIGGFFLMAMVLIPIFLMTFFI